MTMYRYVTSDMASYLKLNAQPCRFSISSQYSSNSTLLEEKKETEQNRYESLSYAGHLFQIHVRSI